MKGDKRRAAIVEAAIHLFAEKGFRGATTRELAAALGVTEPVLYQHFATKNDLYSAIIETKSREGQPHAQELTALSAADNDREFFRFLGNLILETYASDPDYMRLLLFSALERHELADLFFQRQLQGFFDIVASYIQQRRTAGAFQDIDADTAARSFIGMLDYHGLVGLLFGHTAVPEKRTAIVDEAVDIFLCGIRRASQSCAND